MYRVPLTVAALVAAMLVTPSVSAQAADAPHVSPEDNTLFAHRSTASSDESIGWLSTLKDDPDADDTAMGASANYVTSRTWTLTMDPAIAYETVLKGTVEVFAYVGSSSGRGAFQVSTQLLKGSQSLASGAAQNLVAEPAGTGNYQLLRWSLAVDTTLAPGDVLVWRVAAEGAGQTIFLGVAEDRGRSRLVLPVVSVDLPAPAGEPITYSDVSASTFEARLVHADVASQTYIYNWSAGPARVALAYDASVAAGNIVARVADAGNATVWEGTIGAAEVHNSTFQAAAGTWLVHLRAMGFQGTFNLTLQAASPASGTDGGDTQTTSTSSTGASGTTSTTSTGDGGSNGTAQGSPGAGGGSKDSPGAPLLVALVAALLWAARRRT